MEHHSEARVDSEWIQAYVGNISRNSLVENVVAYVNKRIQRDAQTIHRLSTGRRCHTRKMCLCSTSIKTSWRRYYDVVMQLLQTGNNCSNVLLRIAQSGLAWGLLIRGRKLPVASRLPLQPKPVSPRDHNSPRAAVRKLGDSVLI